MLQRASVTSAGLGGSIGHCIIDYVKVVYPDYVKPGVMGNCKSAGGLTNGSVQKNNGITPVNGTKGINGTNKSTDRGGRAIGLWIKPQNGVTMAQQHLPVLRTPRTARKADAGTR